jgi:hypothetical protein
MRALLQRVKHGRVTVDGRIIAEISKGLVILLGIGVGDTEVQVQPLAEKVAFLRIFEDEDGKTNRSILDVGGEAIVVSQFTSMLIPVRVAALRLQMLPRLTPRGYWLTDLSIHSLSRVYQLKRESLALKCWLISLTMAQ